MRSRALFVWTAIVFAAASPVLAQNNRSFVATTGNDTNNCTPGNECRTFTRAIAMTNAGGEIIAISSGGYGSFTVGKALTIVGAPGVTASLIVTSTTSDGIHVAAASNDRVVLRGLHVTLPPAQIGFQAYAINATGFGALEIEDCTVNGGYEGIRIVGPGGSFATVAHSVATGAHFAGILIRSHATVVGSRIEGNENYGLSVELDNPADNPVVSAVDLVSVHNVTGVNVMNGIGGLTVLTLDHAMIFDNQSGGLSAVGLNGANVMVRVSNSVLVDNGLYDIGQGGDSIIGSLGNNLTVVVSGTITPITAR